MMEAWLVHCGPGAETSTRANDNSEKHETRLIFFRAVICPCGQHCVLVGEWESEG